MSRIKSQETFSPPGIKQHTRPVKLYQYKYFIQQTLTEIKTDSISVACHESLMSPTSHWNRPDLCVHANFHSIQIPEVKSWKCLLFLDTSSHWARSRVIIFSGSTVPAVIFSITVCQSELVKIGTWHTSESVAGSLTPRDTATFSVSGW